MKKKDILIKKIQNKTAKIGIIGTGYVGYALALLLANKGFSVIGFDKDEKKVKKILALKNKNLRATLNSKRLKFSDIIIVCVQTPVKHDKTPDLTYLINALENIAHYGKKGQLVILESTIAPGTTRNIAWEKAKTEEKESFLAFSPERIDPGNTKFSLNEIPKVISGIDNESLELATLFYKNIFAKVVPVTSVETAEMVKIFENTFRLVNISLVNELTNYTKKLDVDIWEVVAAAATKPFGFLPHYPGPGIGGHCIPVDPYYLIDDAKKRGVMLNIVAQASKVNDKQPEKVVERALEILSTLSSKKQQEEFQEMDNLTPQFTFPYLPPLQYLYSLKDTKGGKSTKVQDDNQYNVLLVGVTYKKDIDDVRESPALKIWELLEERGIKVSYHDPFVPKLNGYTSKPLLEKHMQNYHLVVILTNHSNIPYKQLTTFQVPILDTRHVYNSRQFQHIYAL